MGTEEESLTGCLITSSYDGFLRVWRDLDSTQVAVAQSGNLSSGYPPPAIDIVTRPCSNGNKKCLIAVAGTGTKPIIHLYPVPKENSGHSNEYYSFWLQRNLNYTRKSTSVTCLKISDNGKKIFVTTDNGKVFMVTMDRIIKSFKDDGGKKDGLDKNGADHEIDLTPRNPHGEKTMGSLDYCGTSVTVLGYKDTECFISDMQGQIHHWSVGSSDKPVKVLFKNESERPIQSIACNVFGEFLIGTDWDGIIYFWNIDSENINEETGQTQIELVQPRKWKLEKPNVPGYGLRAVWCGDGTRFAISQSSGLVYLYHMNDKMPILMDIITAGDISAWVWDCSWDTNGKLLITGNSAGIIKFWEENKLEKELQPESSENLENGLKWKSLNHREIKLREHMSADRIMPNAGDRVSAVISSLLYREVPSEIFKSMRKPEEDRMN